MKNKILLFLLCGVFLVGLTGCGSSSVSEANIEDNDGNKVKMMAQELIDIYKENEIKFEKLYEYSSIELTEEFDSVIKQGNVTCIKLKNNWVIASHESTGKAIDVASELESGNKVKFSGKIYSVNGYCGGMGNNSMVELSIKDDYSIEIIK